MALRKGPPSLTLRATMKSFGLRWELRNGVEEGASLADASGYDEELQARLEVAGLGWVRSETR